MLAFYMDHQFRAGVTHGLRRRNIDVLTAHQDGMETLADYMLLARATELGRVLVTHDKGFLQLAADWQLNSKEFAGIVFAVQKSLDIGNAIEYLELIAHVMTPGEMRNRVEYLPTHR
jgi:hypothetical protein